MILAKREHPEKWYQEQWCAAHKGQVEVALPDGTRCDCVTDTRRLLALRLVRRSLDEDGRVRHSSIERRRKP